MVETDGMVKADDVVEDICTLGADPDNLKERVRLKARDLKGYLVLRMLIARSRLNTQKAKCCKQGRRPCYRDSHVAECTILFFCWWFCLIAVWQDA